MTKLLLVVGLLSVPVAASAEEKNPFENSGASKYETVLQWFDEGRPATFQDVKGYYAGRCFGSQTKEKAANSLLGYLVPKPANDPGPGFPGGDLPGFSVGMNFQSGGKTGAPEAVDGDAGHPEQKYLHQEEMRKILKHFSQLTETPTYGFVYDWENNGRPDQRFDLKLHANGYIVSKVTSLFKQKYGDQGIIDAGQIIRVCYYFKKFDDAIKPVPPKKESGGGGGGRKPPRGPRCDELETGDRLFPPANYCERRCQNEYYSCKCSRGEHCAINRAFCKSDCGDRGRGRRP